MWLSLLVVGFFLATAYLQAIQGMTSAAITCVLSILSLGISFATFESVADMLMSVKPEYAYSVALFVGFIVPFGVMRILMDIWVPRSNLVPHLIDRIAGAGFGAISGFVVSGVMALCVNLMPWGAEGFLGFSRFDPAYPAQQNNLWLSPDRFATGLAGLLSSGTFSGTTLWVQEHPDLVTELGSVQSLPRGVRQVVPEDSVSFRGASQVPYIYEREDSRSGRNQAPPQYTEKDPSTSKVFTRVTLELTSDAADEDKRHRFTPASVRLIGELNGEPTVYTGIAAADKDTPHRHIGWYKKGNEEMKPVAGMLLTAPPNNQIDVVFEHPARFEPRYVEYKLGGRVGFSKSDMSTTSTASAVPSSHSDSTAAPSGTQSDSTSGTSGSRGAGGGRVAGVSFRSSHFGDDLPLSLTAYSGRETEIRNGVIVQGHVQGALADQDQKRDPPVSRMEVPSGQFLLQLNVEKLHAKSTLGKALDFSRSTLENYLVTDDRGKQYTAVGKYAIAEVGGDDYFELLYFPEYVQAGSRFGDFSRIKRGHLKGNYQLVYLYLIDPGAKAVEFSTGGNARAVDLTSENLVAR